MARAKRRNPYTTEDTFEEVVDELESVQDEAVQAGVSMQNDVVSVSRNAAGAAFDALDMFGQPVVKVLDQNRTMFRKMMHAMQDESLRFVNRRLEHAGHAIESTRDCRDVSGLLAVQHEWLMDMARDYAEHTSRFTDMMRGLFEGGTGRVSEIASIETRTGADKHAEQKAGG